MIKEFTFLKDFSNIDFIKEMMKINDSMYSILEAIDNGEITEENKEFTINDLNLYIISLLNGQRGSLGRTISGSWGLVPNDEGMDSDARVEFIYKPTYIAIATLTRFIVEYPNNKLYDEKYKKILFDGMMFCTYRNLHGHGFDRDLGAIEALTILSLGKVPMFLIKNKNFCPKLKKVIESVANEMSIRLENNSAIGAWGVDYSESFRAALETLYLLNNIDFMRSFKEVKNDDFISKKELSW
jgi:hypothetical protein